MRRRFCRPFSFSLISRIGGGLRSDIGALTNGSVTARGMRDFAGAYLREVIAEIGDRRLLDELEGVLVDRLDAGLLQGVARAAADLGDEHGVAVVDGADDGREAVLLAVAALAVEVDAAVADELGAGAWLFVANANDLPWRG